MPITTLSSDTTNASKAAALLAVQVKKDLIATGEFDDDACIAMTPVLVAALIGAVCDDSNRINTVASRLGR